MLGGTEEGGASSESEADEAIRFPATYRPVEHPPSVDNAAAPEPVSKRHRGGGARQLVRPDVRRPPVGGAGGSLLGLLKHSDFRTLVLSQVRSSLGI